MNKHGIARSIGIAIAIIVIVIAAVAGLLFLPKGNTTAITSATLNTSSSINGQPTSQSVSSQSGSSTLVNSSTSSVASSTSSTELSSGTSSQTSTSSVSSLSSSGSTKASLAANETITDPPESSSSQLAYIFDYTLTDQSVQNLGVGSLDFQLVGASGSVYSSTSVLAETIYNVVTLNPGQKTQGQIAFLIPRTDTPATLEFLGGSAQAFDSQLPAPTANVSYILNYGGNLTGAAASQVQINLFSDVNFSTHTQGYWYSGDVIGVNISLDFSLQYSGNGSDIYQVTSINDTAGFKILGYSPNLPVSFGSQGTSIAVYLLIPQASYNGELDFVINVD